MHFSLKVFWQSSFVLGLMAHSAKGDAPSVRDIEAAVLGPRLSISSAVVAIESKLSGASGEQVIRRTLYWGQDRWRLDTLRPNRSPVPGVTQPQIFEVSCFGCEERDKLMFWSDRRLTTDGRIAVAFYRPDSVPEVERGPNIDIRALGLTATNSGGASGHIEAERCRTFFTEANSEEVNEELVEGEPLLHAKYRFPGGVPMQFWAAPRKGFSPLRIEVGNPVVMSAKFEVADHITNGEHLWYPTFMVHERYEGNQLVEREEAKIALSNVNEPLDDQLFKLSGIEQLPAGTTVAYDGSIRPKGRFEWNGSAIVPAKIPPRAELPPMQRPQSTRALVWANLAVITGVLAMVAFRKWFVGRRKGNQI